MSLKAKVESIIYAADEPVQLDQIAAVLKGEIQSELKEELSADKAEHAAAVEIEAASPEAQVSETASGEAEEKEKTKQERAHARHHIRLIIEELMAEYASADRGIEIREVAGGYRMSTKPEHHDVVRAFAKSLKPPMRLSLQALETLAVIAYKQPITAPEISEIRGVDAGGVLASLLSRKLITTAGRKQVIGRPILYKTTKDFLLRFGLKDVNELPSMEEFEKMAGEGNAELFPEAMADATGVPDAPEPSQNHARQSDAEEEMRDEAEPSSQTSEEALSNTGEGA